MYAKCDTLSRLLAVREYSRLTHSCPLACYARGCMICYFCVPASGIAGLAHSSCSVAAYDLLLSTAVAQTKQLMLVAYLFASSVHFCCAARPRQVVLTAANKCHLSGTWL